MTERGMGIRSGVNKQGWENSDFPILCEICLGDNPYLRMTQENFGQECQICTRPFTVFRWKAGTKGRFKKTEICQVCAKLKNVCQTCIFDLEYGLPVEVRDKFLGEKAVSIPTSIANQDYFINQAFKNNDELQLPYNEPIINKEILEKYARKNANYDRNQSHVCSFWLQGECNRGELCPYAHQQRPGHYQIGNPNNKLRDRFHGQNDQFADLLIKQILENQYKVEENISQTIFVLLNGNVVKDDDIRREFEKYGPIQNMYHRQDRDSFEIVYEQKQSVSSLIVSTKNIVKIKDISFEFIVKSKPVEQYKPNPIKEAQQLVRVQNQGKSCLVKTIVPPPPPPPLDLKFPQSRVGKGKTDIVNNIISKFLKPNLVDYSDEQKD